MILLDTHVAVWMTTDKRQLSDAAAAAIRGASREGMGIAIASSSLWEIAMMSTNGQFRLPSSLTEYLSYMEQVFVVIPITGTIAERATKFTSGFPDDPTDRIIGATSLVHNASLVTKDKRMRMSKQVECIW
ncbi:MAG: type II toxin-antitoxin system VapC family toxin [Acidobacteriaceae bacterium]